MGDGFIQDIDWKNEYFGFVLGKRHGGSAMCGICGYVSKRDIRLTQLKEMNDTMYHRGPDDSGEEIYEIAGGYRVGFAQRRLSIIDLSALGHQPMHSENGRVSVVYNGEIYNFQDLKEELSDYPFQSNCDTEVIIAAYLKWGDWLRRAFCGDVCHCFAGQGKRGSVSGAGLHWEEAFVLLGGWGELGVCIGA